MPPRDSLTPAADPADRHADPAHGDRLVLLALGETVADGDELRAHVETCPRCRRELDELEHVVAVGRDPVRVDDLTAPPDRVWDAIRTDIARPPVTAVPVAPQPRERNRRRWLAAAAAVVVLGGAAGAGVAIGRHETRSVVAQDQVQSSARLAPIAAPAGASGTASVVRRADGQMVLRVTAAGLPQRTGYYEVWLYDPDTKRMVAVGTLGERGTGEFTMPSGIDLTVFHVVDVSAQDYDGNAAHKMSMLRGPLTH